MLSLPRLCSGLRYQRRIIIWLVGEEMRDEKATKFQIGRKAESRRSIRFKFLDGNRKGREILLTESCLWSRPMRIFMKHLIRLANSVLSSTKRSYLLLAN